MIDQQMITDINRDVSELLAQDISGHGMQHVERVVQLALAFAKQEGADVTVVTLAALLHDVDDYKIFGQDYADNLTNANAILAKYNVGDSIKNHVLEIIKTMGYNKYLQGVRPATLEGLVVSDADMCDAIGATGILRTHAFALSRGAEFFDKTITPISADLSADQYRTQQKTHSVQHFFDKLLKIPSILATDAGKSVGSERRLIMTRFLREIFVEEGATDWLRYLEVFESELSE